MRYSISSLCIVVLVGAGHTRAAHIQNYHQHHVGLAKDPPVKRNPAPVPASTMPPQHVLTYITPSQGATPVAVTQESQIVTSYVPQFTLCELPPIEFFSISSAPQTNPTASPGRNYSVSIPPGLGTCTTIFEPTITMVCATTLTALDRRYTVTNCDQEITFSTEYGYVLETTDTLPTTSTDDNLSATGSVNDTAIITPAPSIETLTTYYLAPWQQLTAGEAPTEVDLKVCRAFTNASTECIREYQVWSTSLLTFTTSSVRSINISTTIHGRSQLIVDTFVANVTEQITTFSMSTTIDLEFSTEYTTTNSATRNVTSGTVPTSTGPTVYKTLTVEKASETASVSGPGSAPMNSSNSTGGVTSTTTIHITNTIIAGTSTVTLGAPSIPDSSLAASSAGLGAVSTSVDFASMLGIGN